MISAGYCAAVARVARRRGVAGTPAAAPPPAPAGTTPYAPAIESATANGSGGVTIRWAYSETLADGVTAVAPGDMTPAIYHDTVPGIGTAGTKVTGIAPGATSHTFTPGVGSPRYFVMTAENTAGESDPSAQVERTIT